MKKIIPYIMTASIAFIFNDPILPNIRGNEVAKIKAATQVIKDIMNIPEKTIPPSLLKKACGIAVVPGVLKVGLGLGGRYGKGILAVRTEIGNWSNPAFITLSGGSIGWQIGVQSTDIILVFINKKSVDAILEGKFTLGADASIAAGPVGRHVGVKTDVEFKSEIYSYSQSRGLFAGIALEGAAIQIDHNANEAFYEKETTPEDIFSNTSRNVPGCLEEFKKALEED